MKCCAVDGSDQRQHNHYLDQLLVGLLRMRHSQSYHMPAINCVQAVHYLLNKHYTWSLKGKPFRFCFRKQKIDKMSLK